MIKNLEKTAVRYWAVTGIWTFFISAVSLYPMWKYPSAAPSFLDKVAHFAVYLILAILVIRSLHSTTNISFTKNFVFTLIICGGYGILIELVQLLIPGRMADANDALANISGIICGGILVRMVLW